MQGRGSRLVFSNAGMLEFVEQVGICWTIWVFNTSWYEIVLCPIRTVFRHFNRQCRFNETQETGHDDRFWRDGSGDRDQINLVIMEMLEVSVVSGDSFFLA